MNERNYENSYKQVQDSSTPNWCHHSFGSLAVEERLAQLITPSMVTSVLLPLLLLYVRPKKSEIQTHKTLGI